MATKYVDERDGGFYLAGTRISLDSIIYLFRQGESPETICQNFELLTLEQVYGAIAHYLAHKQQLDEYLIRQEAKWEEGRRQQTPLDRDLLARLSAARSALRAGLS